MHLIVLNTAEIREEKRESVFPGDMSEGAHIHMGMCIPITRMPSRVFRIIVGKVRRIPAKYYITESESLFGDRPEFLKADHLTTEHAVNIRYGQFNFFSFLLGHQLDNFSGGLLFGHGVLFLQRNKTKYRQATKLRYRPVII